MSHKTKISFLIGLNLTMAIVILTLSMQLVKVFKGKVAGVQYVTKLNKNNLIFKNNQSKLKYFYEPKENQVEVYNPEWLDYEVKNTINKDGLNERSNYSYQKPNSTYRIITLGDPFTFGQFVNTEENYSEILEDLLKSEIICENIKDYEVINFGVPGYDIEYSVERYLLKAKKYNPNLLIMLISDWNFQIINEYHIPLYQKLVASGVPQQNKKTGLWEAPLLAIDEVQEKYGLEYISNYQLNALRKLNDNLGSDILFVSFSGLKKAIEESIHTIFNNNSHSHKVYLFNKLNIMEDRSYHLLDGHPNKKAHKKFAGEILNYLLENILIDCYRK